MGPGSHELILANMLIGDILKLMIIEEVTIILWAIWDTTRYLIRTKNFNIPAIKLAWSVYFYRCLLMSIGFQGIRVVADSLSIIWSSLIFLVLTLFIDIITKTLITNIKDFGFKVKNNYWALTFAYIITFPMVALLLVGIIGLFLRVFIW